MKMKKLLAVAAGCLMLSFVCTGCYGLSNDEMESQWDRLMEQGQSLHEELVSDAIETNSDILFVGDKKFVFETEGLRIRYAEADDTDDKITVTDTEGFVESLSLEQWESVNILPSSNPDETVFFVQQPVTESGVNDDYKNIANLRIFPEEGYITITVGKGLIDLSDTFEIKDDGYTSTYKVSDDVIQYLQNFQ